MARVVGRRGVPVPTHCIGRFDSIEGHSIGFGRRRNGMASEKAKENKTLVAQCSACGKTLSAELIHAVVVEGNGRRAIIPVCDECREKGWQPPQES